MNAIQKRRKEIHITQEQLAARLATSGFFFTAGSISHWENDRHFPDAFNDLNFRKALAKSLEWDEQEMMLAMGWIVETEPSKDAMRAAELVDRMTPDKRRMALGILEKILET